MSTRSAGEPGSAQFTAALLERLKADPGACPGGEPVLRELRMHSRNTAIFRVACGDRRLVCKAELGGRRSYVEEEHGMLRVLQQRLAGSGVRSLSPVAIYPELRVLVTREESGQTVRHVLDQALRSAAGSPTRRLGLSLMERSADALYRFHAAFGLRRDERGVELAASYMDFHPGNLLVGADGSLIMIDPPPREPERPVQFDLGRFCFGVARAGFTPGALPRRPQRWLDALKAAFVGAYFTRLGRAATAEDIAAIKASEHSRARRAIKRYGQFHRFPNWPAELARLAYFTPLICAYVAFHLPRSYRRLENG